jgi:O-acetylserine/cysteine efflux transporter
MGLTSRTSALVLAAAFWATAISATKYALGGFGAIMLLCVELVVAAIALWLVAVMRGLRPLVSWRYAIVLGLLEPCIAYLGDTLGLERTSAANASMIGGLEATFVVLLAAYFLRERITAALCLAVVVGLLGLGVLEKGNVFAGTGAGDALVLGGAFSAAVYTIVARRVEGARDGGEGVDCLTLTAQQFAVAAVASVACAFAAWAGGWEAAPRDVPLRFWVVAVAVGTVGFAASFLLYNWAITLVEARTSAVILNLIPVFGLICAVAWLGESVSPQRLVGAGLIMASVAVFAWLELRPVPRPVTAIVSEEASWQRV